MVEPPDPGVQRTRSSASLQRSPLASRPFGARGVFLWLLTAVLLVACSATKPGEARPPNPRIGQVSYEAVMAADATSSTLVPEVDYIPAAPAPENTPPVYPQCLLNLGLPPQKVVMRILVDDQGQVMEVRGSAAPSEVEALSRTVGWARVRNDAGLVGWSLVDESFAGAGTDACSWLSAGGLTSACNGSLLASGSSLAADAPPVRPWKYREESTMSNERVAPETKGVTVKLLATVDLGPEIEGMAGSQLRMRMVTIEPGGVFGPLHGHKGRPGTVYILQGTITDHRNGVATDYGPGVGWPEDRNTTHWLENRGTIPAVEISVDIVRQE